MDLILLTRRFHIPIAKDSIVIGVTIRLQLEQKEQELVEKEQENMPIDILVFSPLDRTIFNMTYHRVSLSVF
mgnify:CR=1 FL=1